MNPGLIRSLVQAGVDVHRVEQKSRTLEDLFIDVISSDREVGHE